MIVVPVGRSRIRFNAHRIYSYEQVIELFNGLDLEDFSLVTDPLESGKFIRGASREMANAQLYGCGCFRFTKPPA